MLLIGTASRSGQALRLPMFLSLFLFLSWPATAAERVTLGPGRFESVLPQAKGVATVQLTAYQLDNKPVTNAEFFAFVRAHPKWRRDRIARLFADAQYLSHWAGPMDLGDKARPSQPVTRVSWFSAKAYCEAQAPGARLPTWSEWEYAAAADETSAD